MATKNKSLKPRLANNVDYSHTMDFLDKHEGFESTVYPDGKGIPTIGYGFTDPAYIKMGRMSKQQGRQILQKELIDRDRFLRRLNNWDSLGIGGKTALRSYYYNYPAGFKEATKFMLAWNAGDYEEAIRQIDAGWNDAANPGLKNRRIEELELLRNDPFIMSMLNKKNEWNLPVENLVEQNKKMQYQPWANYHGTDYPINNPAPTSISSWNSPQSPAYTPSQYSASNTYLSLPNVLDMPMIGFSDGKSPIHIKPSKRGSFTAAAKKHGASVAEFERRVLKNPEKYSKAMVKKANFSHNARSWKH